MKIVSLCVKGFRSLKDVTWNPGRLNVVIGANGSGKSNVLRALELLVAAADGGLSRHIQASGGMDAVVWDGQLSTIVFDMTIEPVTLRDGPETYAFELERLGVGSSFRFSKETLINSAMVKSGKKEKPLKLLERDGKRAAIFDANEHRLVPPEDSVKEEETLLSIAGVPFGGNPWIYDFRKKLSSITVYQDIHVNRSALIRQPAVARFEKRLDSDGQNLVSVLHTLYSTNRDFREQMDQAMYAAFGDEFEELSFPPAADQRIQLRVRWKGLKNAQSAADLSDGTLRFLILIAILASPDIAPVVAIDEPEMGLHPSMLPIIAEYAAEASSRSQVVFTTHSPQLLSAFKDAVPTTSVLVWKNGETSLRNLDGQRLESWLQHYSMGDLFVSGELEEME